MFSKILLAGAASALMVSGARAADIVEPLYDWTGPYIGLQGGYGWGQNDVKYDDQLQAVAAASSIFDTDSDDVIIEPNRDGKIGIDGWLGGAHAGYNWQVDSFVLGAEGDIEFSNLSGDTNILFSPTSELGQIKQDIDWLGSLRLRLGYAMDRALIYVTGGAAVGGVDMKIRIDPAVGGGGDAGDTETRWGWTLGGGFEYAFTDEVSANIEYRYTDLGDTQIFLDNNDAVGDIKFDNAFHAVRVGLSWHFGSDL